MAQTPIVNEFMRRLQEAEDRCEANDLAKLFAEDAELVNLTRPTSHMSTHSQSGALASSAQSFWRQYLHAFDNIHSNFTNVIDDGRTAVLEWKSTGNLPMGVPINYNGVSVLEYENGKITRFRTYYDSAAFLAHTASVQSSYSRTAGLPDMSSEVSS